MTLVFSKEDLEKKLKSLEARLPKVLEKVKSAPATAEVEKNEKKYKINPQLIAVKSSRKINKKIKHIKSLLSKAS